MCYLGNLLSFVLFLCSHIDLDLNLHLVNHWSKSFNHTEVLLIFYKTEILYDTYFTVLLLGEKESRIFMKLSVQWFFCTFNLHSFLTKSGKFLAFTESLSKSCLFKILSQLPLITFPYLTGLVKWLMGRSYFIWVGLRFYGFFIIIDQNSPA